MHSCNIVNSYTSFFSDHVIQVMLNVVFVAPLSIYKESIIMVDSEHPHVHIIWHPFF